MIDARVIEIYTTPHKGKPMRPMRLAYAKGGLGLDGDRYALGQGTYSKKSKVIRHITLIGIEDIAYANEGLEKTFGSHETRRNLVTENVQLNELVDRKFEIGRVVMKGVELCTPCNLPGKLSEKPGFKDAFEQSGVNFGGLRAEILESGIIVLGDQINLVDD